MNSSNTEMAYPEKNETKGARIKNLAAAYALSSMALISWCSTDIPESETSNYESGKAVLVHEDNGIKIFSVKVGGSPYYYADGAINDATRGIGELKLKSPDVSVYEVSWQNSPLTTHSMYFIDTNGKKQIPEYEENGLRFYPIELNGSKFYYIDGAMSDASRGVGEKISKPLETPTYKVSWKNVERSLYMVDGPGNKTLSNAYVSGRVILRREICLLKKQN